MGKSLILKGFNVNAKDAWDGSTPLHICAEEGRSDVAKILIENGADIEAKDDSFETPLYRASFAGYKNVIEVLLANGADVNAGGPDGSTPLKEAICQDYLHYACKLLETRYAVEELDLTNDVFEELEQTQENLQLETVRLLITNGVVMKKH